MSLVAVFMALATGVLVGSSLLNQSLIDSQRSTISALAGEKDALRSDLAAAQGLLTHRDNYLNELRGSLLPGRLTGQRVSLVLLPGAAGEDADALTRTLAEAGARVSARISVTDDFFATTDSEEPEVAAKARARDAVVGRAALTSARSRAVAAQFAAAVLTRDPARDVDAGADSLLAGLDRSGFIRLDRATGRGTTAIVLSGSSPEKPSPLGARREAGAEALIAALDEAGDGTVVVGAGGERGPGLARAVRRDATLSQVVSTVEEAESPFGQVVAVLALVEQLGGKAGHYGAGSDTPVPPLSAPATAR